MTIREAQDEMRRVYVNGAIGAFVSGAIWLASAALATAGSRTQAVLALALGGVFIFPIGLLVLAALRRPTAVSKENPLSFLAMQVAFTIPLAIPLILAATQHRSEWFYSGFLIVVGAHYLPFVTLYGLPHYAIAGVLMVAAGIALPSLRPGEFALGGWVGGAMLIVLGVVLLATRGARLRHSP
jgi:drug/metabolite transporter (DMT)-like permease